MENLSRRTIVIALIFLFIGVTFVIKLFILQVYDPSYKFSAESNTRREIINFPARGLIYDRNGKLVVSNQADYDLMVVPRELKPIDSLDFCRALEIEMEDLRALFHDMRSKLKNKKISWIKPSIFYKQLSAKQYGYLQEKLYKFDGFFVQRRTLRKYEYPNAAHILGYVGEVGPQDIERDDYYIRGDYHGISGIESTYEKYLRGEKGYKYVLVDVHGREKGAFRDGAYDIPAVAGKDIKLTIDIELQEYGEKLMNNKIGAIVAIEPQTGELLSMVSAPSYDPSLLVGKKRASHFSGLSMDTLKPLFNRTIMGWYPPGSTFKTINALIGLQEGVITPQTTFECHMGYTVGRFHLGCHHHTSPLDLKNSISHSCNAYYCHVFRDILDNPKNASVQEGFELWKNYLVKFGFGYRLGADVANEIRGFVPNSKYYDKYYNKSWSSLTVVSLAIGQGELLTTPLQMANMAATLANRGTFYTPHVVKDIENDTIAAKFRTIRNTGIDTVHFEPVIEGMEMAVWGGPGSTATIARIPGISICGKTGTAQNPHGEDHSVFIAFAPKENPKIAIAVYVENGGFGARWAAPIASLMVEKYLNKEIDPSRKWTEQRMLEGDLIHDEK
ncbi:penicillin-binding protein 2 [Saccharicrinis fermentans]|uniref:Penicillin-binding protein A n=1 Tax=Saccharicrinis fermentans DSM 9555 = JCM 21142 TaxID=869213 RepID=W7YIB0_9BACT|nr:penicillin-binding protein 2 [Saccharicrinis fermentans]GAF04211.1 penicillin-binding protein A [Saccharicrinis fermentans DSM 9555 = JCM 21142]